MDSRTLPFINSSCPPDRHFISILLEFWITSTVGSALQWFITKAAVWAKPHCSNAWVLGPSTLRTGNVRVVFQKIQHSSGWHIFGLGHQIALAPLFFSLKFSDLFESNFPKQKLLIEREGTRRGRSRSIVQQKYIWKGRTVNNWMETIDAKKGLSIIDLIL